jgi:hypothetical protein
MNKSEIDVTLCHAHTCIRPAAGSILSRRGQTAKDFQENFMRGPPIFRDFPWESILKKYSGKPLQKD